MLLVMLVPFCLGPRTELKAVCALEDNCNCYCWPVTAGKRKGEKEKKEKVTADHFFPQSPATAATAKLCCASHLSVCLLIQNQSITLPLIGCTVAPFVVVDQQRSLQCSSFSCSVVFTFSPFLLFHLLCCPKCVCFA